MNIIRRLIIPLKITDISEFLFPQKIVDRFSEINLCIYSEPTSTCGFCSEHNPKALKAVCVGAHSVASESLRPHGL